MDAILKSITQPVTRDGTLQMQVSSIDYNEYVGRIGIGRVFDAVLLIFKQTCEFN